MLLALASMILAAQDDPAERLQTLPDFKVETILKADRVKHGSWISMCRDQKGRLLLAGQRGQPITRLTIQDGAIALEEDLKLPVSEAMGMLAAFDSLYVNGFGKDSAGRASTARMESCSGPIGSSTQ